MNPPLMIDPELITNCEGDKRALRRTLQRATELLSPQLVEPPIIIDPDPDIQHFGRYLGRHRS